MELDLAEDRWRKSSYSGDAGQCIEVSDGHAGLMPVRDSKEPDGPTLLFPTDAWQSFVTAIRAGEFDSPLE
ncbi:DUF397 domain-containing protein [Kitasatospora purpeofusca]|uniref:DUF397 domain-containing protein n=1 Tax=Kitasatospora purpeofusca TaxID=67352 RepID=UPI0036D41298